MGNTHHGTGTLPENLNNPVLLNENTFSKNNVNIDDELKKNQQDQEQHPEIKEEKKDNSNETQKVEEPVIDLEHDQRVLHIRSIHEVLYEIIGYKDVHEKGAIDNYNKTQEELDRTKSKIFMRLLGVRKALKVTRETERRIIEEIRKQKKEIAKGIEESKKYLLQAMDLEKEARTYEHYERTNFAIIKYCEAEKLYRKSELALENIKIIIDENYFCANKHLEACSNFIGNVETPLKYIVRMREEAGKTVREIEAPIVAEIFSYNQILSRARKIDPNLTIKDVYPLVLFNILNKDNEALCGVVTDLFATYPLHFTSCIDAINNNKEIIDNIFNGNFEKINVNDIINNQDLLEFILLSKSLTPCFGTDYAKIQKFKEDIIKGIIIKKWGEEEGSAIICQIDFENLKISDCYSFSVFSQYLLLEETKKEDVPTIVQIVNNAKSDDDIKDLFYSYIKLPPDLAIAFINSDIRIPSLKEYQAIINLIQDNWGDIDKNELAKIIDLYVNNPSTRRCISRLLVQDHEVSSFRDVLEGIKDNYIDEYRKIYEKYKSSYFYDEFVKALEQIISMEDIDLECKMQILISSREIFIKDSSIIPLLSKYTYELNGFFNVLQDLPLEERNVLLNDKDFCKFYNKVDNSNVAFFVRASKFKDQKAKLAGYEIAAELKFDDSLSELEDVFGYGSQFISEEEKKKKNAENCFASYEAGILPTHCFNVSALYMELFPFYSKDGAEDESCEGKIVYSNLIDNVELKEINKDDPNSYKDFSDGTLCYQGNELFIKVGEELRKLNLTKEAFDILFPANTLVAFSQGRLGDCYLLSALYVLINNVDGREKLLNCFSLDKDGNLVFTFPNKTPLIFKKTTDSEGNITFSSATNDYEGISGSIGWRIIEEAFSVFRDRFKWPTATNYTPDDADHYVMDIEDVLGGGLCSRVFEIFGYDSSFIHKNPLSNTLDLCHSNKWHNERMEHHYEVVNVIENKKLSDCLQNCYLENPNRVICAGSGIFIPTPSLLNLGILPSHAYGVQKIEIDDNGNISYVYLSNPHNTAGFIKVPVKIFNRYFRGIMFQNLNPDSKSNGVTN